MKHTSVWGKILLLVMSVVLALSCLVACNDEEIGKLEETTAAIDADLTELKDLVNEIKKTADAAATAAKLTEVANKLDAASAKADAAATAEALAAAKEELKALTETNKTGLAAANTAIDAAEAAIAAIEAKIATLEGKDASFATEIEAIKTAATNLETSLKAEIDELNDKYDDLKTSVDAKADASDVEEIAGDVAALQTALDLAKTQIAALQAAPNFAENYEKATKVLYGEEKVDGKDYSFDAFEALAATVKASDYAVADYEEFEALVEKLEFFLTRAISVDAIIDCFDKLNVAIDEMPTLLESLQAKVDAVTVVTTAADYLDAMKEVYSKIAELNGDEIVENNIDVPAELKAKYDLIVAAHDNLLAAVAATGDAVAAIDAIGKVVYIDSTDEIEAAKVAIDDYAALYFANDDYIAYYEVDETDLISNYATYEAATARYEQLDAANTNKVEVAAVALGYDAVRPLWSDKAELDEDKAEYAAWLTKYDIDETDDAQSIANIYGTEIEYLNKASAYADAMTLVYTDTVFKADEIVGVEKFNAAIDALLDDNTPLVLWTELANAEAISNMAVGILLPAIEGVADYPVDDAAEDNNFQNMVTVDRGDKFESMYQRMQDLDLANTMLDGLYESHEGLLNNVGFNDFDAIESLKGAVGQIYADNYVTVGDANYNAFAEVNDVNKLIVDLETEYSGITAKVREIYDNVNKYLDPDADMPLAFGNQLDGFMDEVVKIMAMGVTNVNLPLLGEGDAEDVNLSTLFDNLELIIQKYVAKAEAAEIAAATVNAAIESILAADTLNNYDAIVAVYGSLTEWVETYLAADLALADGDVAAVLETVADVKVFGQDDKYDFVTAINYTTCTATYDAIDELYDAADDAWNNTLKGELESFVPGEWDIHDEDAFDTALANWNAYVALYYGDAIADGVGEFAEVAAFEAFKAQYDACKLLVETAGGAMSTIENAIAGLEGTIDASNYADQLILIEIIKGLIADYVDTYCADAINEDAWCADCLENALYVKVLVKEATAKLYEYAEATKALTSEDLDKEIDNTVYMWVELISRGTNTTTINSSLSSAKSAIAKKAPCCVPDAGADAHADADDDCKCDGCGNPVAHVDEQIKDCKCDKCGEDLDHVDADPKDCKCDSCGENLGHVDAEEPKDCVCDKCGNALEHIDDDIDCECDVCGDPYHEDTAYGGPADNVCDWCGEPIVA